MTSRQDENEVPRDDDNIRPQIQQPRPNNVENNLTIDNPVMENDGRQITENISLPQLENINIPCPTSLNPVVPPPQSQNLAETGISQSSTTNPLDTTFAPIILHFPSRPISDIDFSNLPIPEVPNISPMIMTRISRIMPSSSSVLKRQDGTQTGQGDQYHPQNSLRTIKKPTTARRYIPKYTAVKTATHIPKPTLTIAPISNLTSAATAAKSFPKHTATLGASSIPRPISTTITARYILKPLTVTKAATSVPKLTTALAGSSIPILTSATRAERSIPQQTIVTTVARSISKPIGSLTPSSIPKFTARTKTARPILKPSRTRLEASSIPNPAAKSVTHIPVLSTTAARSILKPVRQAMAEKSILSSTKTTRTEIKPVIISTELPDSTKYSTIYTNATPVTTKKCYFPEKMCTSKTSSTVKTTCATVHTRSICIQTSQTTTAQSSMQPRIFSLVAPCTRPRAMTYVVQSIRGSLPVSSVSSPVRPILNPPIMSYLVPSRLEPNRPIKLVLLNTPRFLVTHTPSPDSSIRKAIKPNQSVPSTQAPSLLRPRFPVRNNPVLRYEHRLCVETLRTQIEQRNIITLSSRNLVRGTPRTPITRVSRSAETEDLLNRETRAADNNVRRISFTNPNTNETREYLIHRNTEMFLEVASLGSRARVTDTAALPVPGIVAPTSQTPPNIVDLAKRKKLNQFCMKKNIKGIKRTQANPINIQSSSSSSTTMGPAKEQKIHHRSKLCRKTDNSVSSGYPTWKDENMSQVSSKEGIEDETSNDIGLLDLSVQERLESYMSDVQKFGGQQNDDESVMD